VFDCVFISFHRFRFNLGTADAIFTGVVMKFTAGAQSDRVFFVSGGTISLDKGSLFGTFISLDRLSVLSDTRIHGGRVISLMEFVFIEANVHINGGLVGCLTPLDGSCVTSIFDARSNAH
jgi:hypothetical protein